MGLALEVVGVQATAPGTGGAGAAVAGNSLTLRNTQKPIWFIDSWQQRQAAGSTRFTSPLMHDAVVGLQGGGPIGHSALYRGYEQPLYPQDTLTVNLVGSATAGDVETSCFIALYEDLPGVSANLIDHNELMRRGEDVYCFTNTLALGTGGGWSGEETIIAEVDQLKANTEYAIIGATVQVGAAAVRWVGPDWGNLGVGMPAVSTAVPSSSERTGRNYFRALSQDLGGATVIPVFNSANKSLTLATGLTDENGTDSIVTTMCVRLAPRGKPGKR